MTPIIVSPPFGTYIRDKRTTSVLGSFTLSARPGRFWKIVQFIGDNIRYPVPGGWRNRMELRNPGIGSIEEFTDDVIYSFVGLKGFDWESFLCFLAESPCFGKLHLELNLGCRNVHEYGIEPKTLARFCRQYTITVKLPAGVEAFNYAAMCADAGVHYFHAGNTWKISTWPVSSGSISGKPLKDINLPVVELLAKLYPHIPVVGGGGIYSFEDLMDYYNAGARHFSLATIWFRLWQARRIITRYHETFGGQDAHPSNVRQ